MSKTISDCGPCKAIPSRGKQTSNFVTEVDSVIPPLDHRRARVLSAVNGSWEHFAEKNGLIRSDKTFASYYSGKEDPGFSLLRFLWIAPWPIDNH